MVIVLVLLLIYFFSQFIYDTVEEWYVTVRRKYFYGNDWFINNMRFIFPNVKRIRCGDFDNLVNANRFKKNEYTIVKLKSPFDKIISYDHKALETALREILEYVTLDGAKISYDDVVVVDVLKSRGSYFPCLHTDIEWGVFDKSDGFQIWYLCENDEPHGNMFILDTEQVRPATYLNYLEDKVEVRDQCDYSLVGEIDVVGEMYYLDMEPGECFIMNKNVYHMSDIKNSPNRRAVNFRVVIKDEDGGIPVNFSKKCAYNTFMNNFRISSIDRKIFPDTFDLIKFT